MLVFTCQSINTEIRLGAGAFHGEVHIQLQQHTYIVVVNKFHIAE